MSDTLSWSDLSSYRRECVEKFGGIRQLRIITSPYDLIEKFSASSDTVLDVGSGVDMPLKQYIGQRNYYSLETDPRSTPNFRTVADIPADLTFDTVWSNQVLEHVTIAQAIEIVQVVSTKQQAGGIFIATIPNIAHPVRFWDATHITPWAYSDFYGLFRMHGYDVIDFARYGKVGLPDNPIKRFIVKTIAEAYRIDWMDSIVIVAQKSSS